MKLLAILFLFVIALTAQTRTVNVSWTGSSSGVTGYTISTSASGAGPWKQVACTGVVAGSVCVSGSTNTTDSYADTETVGTTVWYQVIAVAAACTPTTPVNQACGSSVPVSTSANIPPEPSVATVTLRVN